MAAIEFAFVFPVIFLILYAFVTFGSALFTQLAVSRAVQDGARAVAFLPPNPGPNPTDYAPITDEVIESLAGAAVAPLTSNDTIENRRAWLEINVRNRITVIEEPCNEEAGAGTCVVVSLSFPYGDGDGTRIFPSIDLPLIGGTESWMPDALSSRASIRL